MRAGPPIPIAPVPTDAQMMADPREWCGSRHTERKGNTPSSPFASPRDDQGRFTVDDGRRRGLQQQARPWASPTCAAACGPCWMMAGAPPSSPPTLPPPDTPSAAPSPTTTSPSHLAASGSPGSADMLPTSAPPPRSTPPPASPISASWRAGVSGGPACRPGVDAGGGDGRARHCAQHSAASAGLARCAAGGADPGGSAPAARGPTTQARAAQQRRQAFGRIRVRRA